MLAGFRCLYPTLHARLRHPPSVPKLFKTGDFVIAAQQEFDAKYITSTEICQTLGIHRCTVLMAVRSGRLPQPIVIKRPDGAAHILLWIRDEVLDKMAEWSIALASRKGAA